MLPYYIHNYILGAADLICSRIVPTGDWYRNKIAQVPYQRYILTELLFGDSRDAVFLGPLIRYLALSRHRRCQSPVGI